jgi:Flp pilus assembly pilin Flp
MKGIRGRVRRLTTHLRGTDADRGVTSIEYAGLVIIVAAIIIAIRALGLDATISSAIGSWVNSVVGGG